MVCVEPNLDCRRSLKVRTTWLILKHTSASLADLKWSYHKTTHSRYSCKFELIVSCLVLQPFVRICKRSCTRPVAKEPSSFPVALPETRLSISICVYRFLVRPKSLSIFSCSRSKLSYVPQPRWSGLCWPFYVVIPGVSNATREVVVLLAIA